MVIALWKATFGVCVVGIVGYLVVMVPVGRKTLFEHGLALWRTQAARELREDLSAAGEQVVVQVARSLEGGDDAAQAPARD